MLDTVNQACSSSSWLSESNVIRIGSRWAQHIPFLASARLLLGFYPYNDVVLSRAGAEAYAAELDQKSSPLAVMPHDVIATEGTSRKTSA